MEKLECKNSLELAEKLGSRVRVFLDGYNGWRVAPIKTLKNSFVLNQIDCDIEKRCGEEGGKGILNFDFKF